MRLDVGASLGQETAASSPILGPLLPFSFSQGVAHPCSFFFFMVVLGHCCSMWAFSSCNVWASHCSGFSCCRAQTLGIWTSLVVALRLSSCVLVL